MYLKTYVVFEVDSYYFAVQILFLVAFIYLFIIYTLSPKKCINFGNL